MILSFENDRTVGQATVNNQPRMHMRRRPAGRVLCARHFHAPPVRAEIIGRLDIDDVLVELPRQPVHQQLRLFRQAENIVDPICT